MVYHFEAQKFLHVCIPQHAGGKERPEEEEEDEEDEEEEEEDEDEEEEECVWGGGVATDQADQ